MTGRESIGIYACDHCPLETLQERFCIECGGRLCVDCKACRPATPPETPGDPQEKGTTL